MVSRILHGFPNFRLAPARSVAGSIPTSSVRSGFYLEVRLEFGSTLSVPLFAAEETYQTHGFCSEFLLDCRPENASNRLHQLIPPIGLSEELFSSRGRQPIIAGAAIVFRCSPERSDPAPILKPM